MTTIPIPSLVALLISVFCLGVLYESIAKSFELKREAARKLAIEAHVKRPLAHTFHLINDDAPISRYRLYVQLDEIGIELNRLKIHDVRDWVRLVRNQVLYFPVVEDIEPAPKPFVPPTVVNLYLRNDLSVATFDEPPICGPSPDLDAPGGPLWTPGPPFATKPPEEPYDGLVSVGEVS